MNLNTNIVSLNLGLAETRAASSSCENLLLDVGTCSDAGRVRENNEDSVRAAPEMSLFVLSDGMGGMACGEVASSITVNTLVSHCREAAADPAVSLFGPRIAGVSHTSNRLASAIQLANRIVYRTASESSSRQGMGATVVAAQCKDQRLHVAHVGDSRAYRLRNQRIEQLTQDHSLAAEQMRLGQITQDQANASSLQHILTRAVGIEPQLQVEISEEPLLDGDTILLCSDGLTHELSDKQIAGVLRESKNAQEAAEQLVDLANQAGGNDNITTIVIRKMPRMRKVFSRFGLLGRWFNATPAQS